MQMENSVDMNWGYGTTTTASLNNGILSGNQRSHHRQRLRALQTKHHEYAKYNNIHNSHINQISYNQEGTAEGNAATVRYGFQTNFDETISGSNVSESTSSVTPNMDIDVLTNSIPNGRQNNSTNGTTNIAVKGTATLFTEDTADKENNATSSNRPHNNYHSLVQNHLRQFKPQTTTPAAITTKSKENGSHLQNQRDSLVSQCQKKQHPRHSSPSKRGISSATSSTRGMVSCSDTNSSGNDAFSPSHRNIRRKKKNWVPPSGPPLIRARSRGLSNLQQSGNTVGASSNRGGFSHSINALTTDTSNTGFLSSSKTTTSGGASLTLSPLNAGRNRLTASFAPNSPDSPSSNIILSSKNGGRQIHRLPNNNNVSQNDFIGTNDSENFNQSAAVNQIIQQASVGQSQGQQITSAGKVNHSPKWLRRQRLLGSSAHHHSQSGSSLGTNGNLSPGSRHARKTHQHTSHNSQHTSHNSQCGQPHQQPSFSGNNQYQQQQSFVIGKSYGQKLFHSSSSPSGLLSKKNTTTNGGRQQRSSTGNQLHIHQRERQQRGFCSSGHPESDRSSTPPPSPVPEIPSHFVVATSNRPHPEKEATGGEDAFFVSRHGTSFGVADGVGGWTDHGVNAGAFSRELMSLACSYLETNYPVTNNNNATTTTKSSNNKKTDNVQQYPDPLSALQSAYDKTTAVGTSTALVVSILNGNVYAVNVGDSGFMVLRRSCNTPAEEERKILFPSTSTTQGSSPSKPKKRWRLVYQTTEQTHYFNCPFQLGTNSMDRPEDAQKINLPVERGDIIVAATDGLFDNLFNEEILQLLDDVSEHYETEIEQLLRSSTTSSNSAFLEDFTSQLTTKCFNCAANDTRRSPFAVGAAAAGYSFAGGKQDDITIITALIL